MSKLKHNLQLLLANNRPLFLYILINVSIFVAIGLCEVLFFLFNQPNIIQEGIRTYAAFPAAILPEPFKIYTVFTYQFLHKDLFHLLFNMLTLFWFGKVFTDFLKPRQFHFVYFFGGVSGALTYSIAFNLFPAFELLVSNSVILGASASVMAIAAAAATLAPNYTFRLLFFGVVRIKYLVLVILGIDILLLGSGGSFAHLGGALAGFTFIKLLQNGRDLSSFLKAKPKLKVVKTKNTRNRTEDVVAQEEIDRILDKISSSGYEGLSSEDKKKLFRASGKN